MTGKGAALNVDRFYIYTGTWIDLDPDAAQVRALVEALSFACLFHDAKPSQVALLCCVAVAIGDG